MTKISQLSSIGDSLAIGDQFLIRDIDDTGSPNKSVTISGMTRALDTGTALAPALAFASDKNTGIYSPGADQVAISTNGTGRLFVDANGRIIIGASTAAIGHPLEIAANANGEAIGLRGRSSDGISYIGFYPTASSTENARIQSADTAFLSFHTGSLTTERMRIDSSGRVGIGTSAASSLLHLVSSGQPTITVADDAGRSLQVKAPDGSTNPGFIGTTTNHDFLLQAGTTAGGLNVMRFNTAGSERARIDSSGRLLVGTSNTRGALFNSASGADHQLQIESAFAASFVRNEASGSGPFITLGKSRGSVNGSTIIINAGDDIGSISFQGADGSKLVEAARIFCTSDGTPGAGDMPGRLVFSTTADGASSPTERLRITSAGVLQVADAGNITVGTTTGTKIGTATTQKLGFFDKTPVVQPIAVADATDAASAITQLNALLARMRDLGLIAT